MAHGTASLPPMHTPSPIGMGGPPCAAPTAPQQRAWMAFKCGCRAASTSSSSAYWALSPNPKKRCT